MQKLNKFYKILEKRSKISKNTSENRRILFFQKNKKRCLRVTNDTIWWKKGCVDSKFHSKKFAVAVQNPLFVFFFFFENRWKKSDVTAISLLTKISELEGFCSKTSKKCMFCQESSILACWQWILVLLFTEK